MMALRHIFADAYRVHRSSSHGNGFCVMTSVGLSVGGAMGGLSEHEGVFARGWVHMIPG